MRFLTIATALLSAEACVVSVNKYTCNTNPDRDLDLYTVFDTTSYLTNHRPYDVLKENLQKLEDVYVKAKHEIKVSLTWGDRLTYSDCLTAATEQGTVTAVSNALSTYKHGMSLQVPTAATFIAAVWVRQNLWASPKSSVRRLFLLYTPHPSANGYVSYSDIAVPQATSIKKICPFYEMQPPATQFARAMHEAQAGVLVWFYPYVERDTGKGDTYKTYLQQSGLSDFWLENSDPSKDTYDELYTTLLYMTCPSYLKTTTIYPVVPYSKQKIQTCLEGLSRCGSSADAQEEAMTTCLEA